MSTADTSLPYIDEHAVTIDASRPTVWRSLVEMPDAMISQTFARMLGCADSEAVGRCSQEPGERCTGCC